MAPVPGGRFAMGSPDAEPGRQPDEGPRHEVVVAPFWMGKCEVTWDEFDTWWVKHPGAAAPAANGAAAGSEAQQAERDRLADAVSYPSLPYVSMDKGMGRRGGFPAVCMSQLAARQYTKWLSKKTGRFYRLPTEAEWEYACRAGTSGAYNFGNDPAKLPQFAWYFDNADERYHKVGQLAPNAWGLYDMHGNVAEWVLDQFAPDTYAKRGGGGGEANAPLVWPTQRYPRGARGGSWDDEAPALRSAARGRSHPRWNLTDGSLPKSIWYERDAPFVGFRVVRPLHPPPPSEQERYWAPDTETDREEYLNQRQLRGQPTP